MAKMQHPARNVHSVDHRVADVIAGSEENKGWSIVNHDHPKGFAELGATLETTQPAAAVVTA